MHPDDIGPLWAAAVVYAAMGFLFYILAKG
jgi:hypothetical protein